MASATMSTNSGSPGTRPARFTATDTGLPPGSGQVEASFNAVRSTHRSSSRSRSPCSATGRKMSGGSRPRSGCGHRTSASAVCTTPSTPTTGWKCSARPSFCNASRSWPSRCTWRSAEAISAALASDTRPGAGPLGLEHRRVGEAQQVVAGGAGTVRHGRADRRRHPDQLPVHRHRGAQQPGDLRGQRVHAADLVQVPADDHVLVAGQPRRRAARRAGRPRAAAPAPPAARRPRRGRASR